MTDKIQKRIIIIKPDTRGSSAEFKKVARGMAQINKNTKKAASSLSLFGKAFAAYAGARQIASTVSGFTRIADSLSLLQDRIKIFVGSSEQAKETFIDLAAVANKTKTTIGSIATVYNRVALATNDLGISSDAVIGITEALQQTFRLSGASIAEATAATIQLSQGLSSGQLRGQELRSVVEQNAVFAKILADEFGVARGQLIKLAEAGVFTSEVVLKALSKNFKKITKDAEQLNQTFEQSAKILGNEFALAIKKLNESLELNTKFAELIENIIKAADALQYLGDIVAEDFKGVPKVLGFVSDALKTFSTSLQGFELATDVFRGIGQLIKDLGQSDKTYLKVKKGLLELKLAFQETFIDQTDKASKAWARFAVEKDKFGNIIGEIAKTTSASRAGIEKTRLEIAIISETLLEAEDAAKDYGEALAEAVIQISGKGIKTIKDLNKAYAEGGLLLSEYNKKLLDIQSTEILGKFKEGRLTLKEFNKEAADFMNKFADVSPFKQGAAKYVEAMGDLSTNIISLSENMFSSLEENLLDFVKTGKFSFQDFAQSVLDDINRIVLRLLVVKPIAEAVVGALTGKTYATPSAPTFSGTADVNEFLSKAASGGVITTPTLLSSGFGNTLAGENGPEGILPLSRSSDGSLGVKASGGSGGSAVTVNVMNNASGTEASASERTNADGSRVIDVMIEQKTKELFTSGKLDKTLNQSYGLRRRGA